MNRIYGTDGNVYETSISNGKENMLLKNEKEEFAIAELDNIKAEILDKVSMYENEFLIEPHFVEEVINKRISEIKGENK